VPSNVVLYNVLYAVEVGVVKGCILLIDVSPARVSVKLLGPLSIILFDRHVSKTVPDIAVNGLVGGVNDAVYSAVPFTTLKLDMYPFNGDVPGYAEPIVPPDCVKLYVDEVVPVD